MSQEPIAPPSTSPKSDRKTFVLSMIGLSVLLFLATEMLLYYRWATMRVPSAELDVLATTTLRGAIVEVDGPLLAQPHKVTIGLDDRYNPAFFLEPGDYEITVKLSGERQYKARCRLNKQSIGTVDLTHLKPTTQPITGPLSPPSESPQPLTPIGSDT